MLKFVFEDVKARQNRDQTIKVAISAATGEKQRLVEDATGVRFFPSAVPRSSDAQKRQRIEQEFAAAALWYKPHTVAVGRSEQSNSRFIWTGPEDSAEEVERMMLRIQALIGWDEFPSELVQRDVHAELLINVRIEDSTPWISITGMLLLVLLQLKDRAKDARLFLFNIKVATTLPVCRHFRHFLAACRSGAWCLYIGRYTDALCAQG